MKKQILILILISFSLVTNAQYKKIPLDSNHYWHEYFFYVQVSGSFNCNYQYNIVKDTIVASNIFKKVVLTNYLCNPGGSPWVPYKGFLRQDTLLKRVLILDNSFQEKILYNFNKVAGDTALMYNGAGMTTFTLNTKDSLLLNDGLYHRRYYFVGTSYNGTVIEGVGGYTSLLSPYFQGPGTGCILVCLGKSYPTQSTIYHQSGPTFSCSVVLSTEENSVLQSKTDVDVFPNPNSGQINVLVKNNFENIKSIIVKDVLGKEIKRYDNLNSLEYSLDLKSVDSGIYFITILFIDKKINRRIIKN